MPVLSWGHSQYWSGATGEPPESPTPSRGGYPAWQTSIISCNGFGVTQIVWEWAVQRLHKDKS